MPRLPHALILQAHRISPLLPLVLRGCRELPSAINELRWLREHVVESLPEPRDKHHQQRKLLQLCKRRARGEPLQYLLGTQPFGELEIKCRPGVLIPRPETEAYTTHLAHLLLEHKPKLLVEKYTAGNLRVIDYCSGSGCISLLLYALLSRDFPKLKVEGVDISPQALTLANENLQHNLNQGYLFPSAISSLGSKVSFVPKDIFSERDDSGADIIISNPPYISQDGFNKDTSRSVRIWEPKLALVPKEQQFQESQTERNKCAPEDIFYYQLLQMHQSPRSKLMLMEVVDLAQAKRVAELAARFMEDFKILIEIWRDWPDQEPDSDGLKVVKIRSGESSTLCHDVQIKGYGIARAVVVYCGDFIELAGAP